MISKKLLSSLLVLALAAPGPSLAVTIETLGSAETATAAGTASASNPAAAAINLESQALVTNALELKALPTVDLSAPRQEARASLRLEKKAEIQARAEAKPESAVVVAETALVDAPLAFDRSKRGAKEPAPLVKAEEKPHEQALSRFEKSEEPAAKLTKPLGESFRPKARAAERVAKGERSWLARAWTKAKLGAAALVTAAIAACGGGGGDSGYGYVGPSDYVLTQSQIDADRAMDVPLTPGDYTVQLGGPANDLTFRFDLASDGRLSLWLDGVPGAEYDMVLLDQWGFIVAEDDVWSTGLSALIERSVPAGSYDVILHNKRTAGAGEYTSFEAHYTAATQTYINDALSGYVEEVQYSYDAPETGTLTVSVPYVPGVALGLSLYDAAGFELARADMGFNQDVVISAPVVRGPYRIGLRNLSGGGAGFGYEITADWR